MGGREREGAQGRRREGGRGRVEREGGMEGMGDGGD